MAKHEHKHQTQPSLPNVEPRAEHPSAPADDPPVPEVLAAHEPDPPHPPPAPTPPELHGDDPNAAPDPPDEPPPAPRAVGAEDVGRMRSEHIAAAKKDFAEITAQKNMAAVRGDLLSEFPPVVKLTEQVKVLLADGATPVVPAGDSIVLADLSTPSMVAVVRMWLDEVGRVHAPATVEAERVYEGPVAAAEQTKVLLSDGSSKLLAQFEEIPANIAPACLADMKAKNLLVGGAIV